MDARRGVRVLIYSHSFAPAIGGVETFVMQLARGLAAEEASPQTQTFETIVVTRTPKMAFADEALPFRVVRQPSLVDLLKEIRAADVVQLAGPSFIPLFFSLLLEKPVVLEQHGYQAICPNGSLLYQPTQQTCVGHFMAGHYRECLRCNAHAGGWWRSLRLLLLTFPRLWLCRRATVHACISGHVQGRLGFPRSRVIYYGIEDSSVGGQARVHVTSPNVLCFAYVGRLVSEKGLPTLFHAVRQLRVEGYSVRLKIVGDGPERERLEKLTCQLDIRQEVLFTGFLCGGELEAALSDVAVVVMPSIWEETAGLAAIEQMMRGRLAVVSDIGGLGEVVASAGLKFPPGDVPALANCLKQILDRPALVVELGARARQRALGLFRQERMVREYARTYERVCE